MSRTRFIVDGDKVFYKGLHVATLHHVTANDFSIVADDFKRFLEKRTYGVEDEHRHDGY